LLTQSFASCYVLEIQSQNSPKERIAPHYEGGIRDGTRLLPAIGSITKAEFAAPHPDLQAYVTAYYTADVHSPDEQLVEDLLHPEWGSVRYVCAGEVLASAQPDPLMPVPRTVLVGHSARATRIACAEMRIASFGLLPLGWHHFVGLSAHKYADTSIAADQAKTRVDFAALAPAVAAATQLDDIAAIFDNALLHALLAIPASARQDDALIQKLHHALMDTEVSTVAQISDRVGLTGAQVERLSKRIFGFPPKLLIRRQRFLRTLALFMRHPKSKWGEILDPQYHDQAHFNRDFQRFFAMSPSEYLAREKPIITTAAMARMQALGDPLQGLHQPGAQI
jgi:AraC-like DNA-binding protein